MHRYVKRHIGIKIINKRNNGLISILVNANKNVIKTLKYIITFILFCSLETQKMLINKTMELLKFVF